MAALDFPTSPTIGDQYAANGRTWEWDGASWNIVPPDALLSTLGDVSITSVSANEVFRYDGSNWVNTDAMTIDSSSRITASSGAAFVYNTTTTSTSKTLVNGEQCFVDTATQTLTLPASPSVGDNVRILVGNFTDTVVARNGSNIMGLAEDLTIDVAYLGITLVYADATNGWTMI